MGNGDYPENLHVVFCPNKQRSFSVWILFQNASCHSSDCFGLGWFGGLFWGEGFGNTTLLSLCREICLLKLEGLCNWVEGWGVGAGGGGGDKVGSLEVTVCSRTVHQFWICRALLLHLLAWHFPSALSKWQCRPYMIFSFVMFRVMWVASNIIQARKLRWTSICSWSPHAKTLTLLLHSSEFSLDWSMFASALCMFLKLVLVLINTIWRVVLKLWRGRGTWKLLVNFKTKSRVGLGTCRPDSKAVVVLELSRRVGRRRCGTNLVTGVCVQVRSAFAKIIVILAHVCNQDGPCPPPLLQGLYGQCHPWMLHVLPLTGSPLFEGLWKWGESDLPFPLEALKVFEKHN